jgi:SAM-dependent methyltransferase
MIERSDWSRIAHAGIRFMGPYDERHLTAVLDRLALPPAPRVVDLGCGTGSVLAHLAATHGATGIGVDLDAPPAGIDGIIFLAADATTYAAAEQFDLAVSIGSVGAPPQLAALVRPGGAVLWGEGYWRRKPDDRYLKALGATEDELDTLEGMTSSVDDFDAYEDGWARNGERYAAAHAGEDGVQPFLEWIRTGVRRYRELGGRETLGFALMPFRKAA